jgi:thiol:disulfide interchange protein DsbD
VWLAWVFAQQVSALRDAEDAAWQPYSAQKVASLQAAGKPVFIDFTAAWCVTCQVNKRVVLSRDDVMAAFRDRNVTLVRADWTRRDPEIARALSELGRSGVPVYVLYRPGRAPELLPELLTPQRVLEALDG